MESRGIVKTISWLASIQESGYVVLFMYKREIRVEKWELRLKNWETRFQTPENRKQKQELRNKKIDNILRYEDAKISLTRF
jgi:hypothetical protein